MTSTVTGPLPLAVRLADVRARCLNGDARATREAARVSRAEMAADLGVQAQTLARWERGDALPPTDRALRYQALLEQLEVRVESNGATNGELASSHSA